MSEVEELREEIARLKELREELISLKEQQQEDRLTIGFGNKGNVKVGGKALGQRFPVTLYAPSWLKVLDQADEIRQFIEDNKDNLTWER
jgi:hypothetical protein